jgi:hypothetical protein
VDASGQITAGDDFKIYGIENRAEIGAARRGARGHRLHTFVTGTSWSRRS